MIEDQGHTYNLEQTQKIKYYVTYSNITLNFSKTLSSTSGQISRAFLAAVGSGTIQMVSERGTHILPSF